jgi:hypothetical protein
MSKIEQDKFSADLVGSKTQLPKYYLKRFEDNLGMYGDVVIYIEWNDSGNVSHNDIAIGRSVALNPGFDFNWLTTTITEIIEQREGYVKFKTENSTYELTES